MFYMGGGGGGGGVFRRLDFQYVGCLECSVFGICDVCCGLLMESLGCGMLRM